MRTEVEHPAYPADVYLREVSTGAVRIYRATWSDHPNEDFIWDEGNYACDCNRATFWARAGGETAPDAIPCSRGLYVVDKIVRVDSGAVVYSETDD